MTARLFLHVGLPKTGTTSMQKWFLDHHAALEAAGCLYPTTPALHNFKQGYTVPDLLRNPGLPSIAQALTQGGGHRDVLLSNEGMSNHFHDFPAAHLAQLRALTTAYDVTVFLFRRDPERWLHSYHRQAVLNPRNTASELWGTSGTRADIRDHYRITRLLDHAGLAQDMRTGFGARACRVLDFDNPDAFTLMLEEMGLAALAHLPLPRINESIPDWAVEMMRRINGKTGLDRVRKAWKATLYHFLQSNHTVLRDNAGGMTPDDIRHVDPAVLEGMPAEVPVAALQAYIATQLPARFQTP